MTCAVPDNAVHVLHSKKIAGCLKVTHASLTMLYSSSLGVYLYAGCLKKTQTVHSNAVYVII